GEVRVQQARIRRCKRTQPRSRHTPRRLEQCLADGESAHRLMIAEQYAIAAVEVRGTGRLCCVAGEDGSVPLPRAPLCGDEGFRPGKETLAEDQDRGTARHRADITTRKRCGGSGVPVLPRAGADRAGYVGCGLAAYPPHPAPC